MLWHTAGSIFRNSLFRSIPSGREKKAQDGSRRRRIQNPSIPHIILDGRKTSQKPASQFLTTGTGGCVGEGRVEHSKDLHEQSLLQGYRLHNSPSLPNFDMLPLRPGGETASPRACAEQKRSHNGLSPHSSSERFGLTPPLEQEGRLELAFAVRVSTVPN